MELAGNPSFLVIRKGPSFHPPWPSMLTMAGIDTSTFKAHFVRGASTSAAVSAGLTTNQIMNAAD